MAASARHWLVPTLCTIPACAVLLALGVWQLQRHSWKTALIEARRAALTASPTGLPASNMWPPVASYLQVRVDGRFLANRTILIGPRKHKGQAGLHVLSPFHLADGRHVLVERGFVAGDGRRALPWQDSIDTRQRRIQGILRTDLTRPRFAPDNVPKRDEWYWYDVAAMARHLKLELIPAVLVLAPASDAASPPLALAPRVDLPNDHLQYALTWFALAAVLLVIFGLFLKRGMRRP